MFGYYNSADPWVIRKHVELFIAADIDFLALDFTNAIVYDKVLTVLLEVLEEYRLAGHHVPQLTFFTNTASGEVVNKLYNMMYSKNLYKELWFYGPYDKPLMIAWEDQLTEEQRNFFFIRPPQWPEADFMPMGFPYVDKVRPQRTYTDLVVVSVSQHVGGAFSWSFKGPHGSVRESWGRGYTTDNPTNWDPERIERGANFQEQWDYALKVDPQIIFVTGWNEWIACKFTNTDVKNYGTEPYWVDTFNTEFSRDIEMTMSRSYVKDENGKYIEEGYGDNFYLQLINNVRRFKGIKDEETPSNEVIYKNTAVKKVERNFIGSSDRTRYTQNAPDNFIKQIKVNHDKENIYFEIETDEKITEKQENKTNWMNLFIGVEGSKKPSFESFQYVVNRYPGEKTTSLEVSKGGYSFEKVSDISYEVNGNIIKFTIPRKALNLKKNSEIYFKAADSIEKQDDIMDYYVSGCSVPLGRLSFSYSLNQSSKLSLTEIITLGVSSAVIILCAAMLTIYLKKGKGEVK